MLKPISRLRSICKGDLNISSYSNVHRIRKKILQSIPILSIFAFLGITTYSIGLFNIGLIGSILSDNTNGEVYAAESTNNTTTSSLIIDNGTASDSTATARGNVAYSSHTVQVKASNIESYQLTITGPTNLTNDGTTISGAGNKTPANMANNSWGYAFGANTANNESTLAYQSFTGSAQTLTGDSVSNNAVDFTRKLVFAAKFDQNAAGGHYRANVKLNLTITPKRVLSLSEISKMQEMSIDTCAVSPIGLSITLTDTRDNSIYTVRRHEDGKCWMTQNLRIVDKAVTPADTDITSNYTIPASTDSSGFSVVHYGGNVAYGAYYGWGAATAGSGPYSGSRDDAAASVCPKGWKLPSRSDYSTLLTAIGVSNNASGSEIIRNNIYKFQLAGSASSTGVPSVGYYWTRTVLEWGATDNSYVLAITNEEVTTEYQHKNGTYSVRCVAYSS